MSFCVTFEGLTTGSLPPMCSTWLFLFGQPSVLKSNVTRQLSYALTQHKVYTYYLS